MSLSTKKIVINIFMFSYVLIAGFALTIVLFFRDIDKNSIYFLQIGLFFGKASLICYVLTLFPGIADRFTIKHLIFRLLRMYRRYLGILMYTLALSHVMLVKIQFAETFTDYLPQNQQETFGLIALTLLFSLFITSNDYSVRMLKKVWFQIHKLTYLAMFFIFLHVSIVERGLTSLLIGATVLIEIASVIFQYYISVNYTKNKNKIA